MNLKDFNSTNPASWAAFVTRITLGLVVFPHGAQKLLGWFGGKGFDGAMNFLTQMMHLPWIIGFLVILVESIGALALIVGFFTRFFSFAMFINFVGITFLALNNGFFINWASKPNTPEGIEFHLLILGLCIATAITGGGKFSLDAALFKKETK